MDESKRSTCSIVTPMYRMLPGGTAEKSELSASSGGVQVKSLPNSAMSMAERFCPSEKPPRLSEGRQEGRRKSAKRTFAGEGLAGLLVPGGGLRLGDELSHVDQQLGDVLAGHPVHDVQYSISGNHGRGEQLCTGEHTDVRGFEREIQRPRQIRNDLRRDELGAAAGVVHEAEADLAWRESTCQPYRSSPRLTAEGQEEPAANLADALLFVDGLLHDGESLRKRIAGLQSLQLACDTVLPDARIALHATATAQLTLPNDDKS
eukprot:scaffold1006_cov270-Pinguiococcus_pyrenoidosus.AAC.27